MAVSKTFLGSFSTLIVSISVQQSNILILTTLIKIAVKLEPLKEFTQHYYNREYFADEKGKAFKRENGSIEYWGYKSPEGEFLGAKEIAKAWKTMFNPKNMLDIGGGRGTFIAYARDVGIEAKGFDWSEWAINNPYPRCKKEWLKLHDATKPWPYENASFDLVVALDFFEHIYQPDLDFVVSEMYCVAKKWVFLQIATVDGVKEQGYILKKAEPIPLARDGRTWAGHCTVCSEAFWYRQFEHDDWMPRRDMVNWFCSLVGENILRNWVLNAIIILEKIE